MMNEAQSLSLDLAQKDCELIHSLKTAKAQNLYGLYGSVNGTLENAVQAWLDEKILIGTNATIHEIGHYLNIISPELSGVGCATAYNTISNCLVTTCNYI
jgi:hypothetical protein